MKKLIVANWKMNPQTEKEVHTAVKTLSTSLVSTKNAEVVICPPYVFIPTIRGLKNKKIALGSQTVATEEAGPFTGEVSASMLRDIKVTYCIVGHSERRSRGETDDMISKKMALLIKSKITPILCIGETIRSSDGEYLQVVKNQLTASLTGINKNYIKQLVIAYEPVWALSSTENRHDATAYDFEEMRIYIRKILTDVYSPLIAKSVRILYGGSVSTDTAHDFLTAGADGLLVGKASLDPKQFASIIHSANNIH